MAVAVTAAKASWWQRAWKIRQSPQARDLSEQPGKYLSGYDCSVIISNARLNREFLMKGWSYAVVALV